MLGKYYITGTCKIESGSVFINGHVAYKGESASVPDFLLSVYQHFGLNYPKFYKMDNLSKLGWLASEMLLKDFNRSAYNPEKVGIVLANSNSSLDNDMKYFNSLQEFASPSLFVYTLPNIVIGEVCIRNHFKGEHAFYIQEAFDAAFVAQQVDYLLKNDILEACICGWADVLEQDYKAVLFMVEKGQGEDTVAFSAEHMDSTFNNSGI